MMVLNSLKNLLGFGGFEGLQVSFGIGAFPFSFLAATFNFNGNEARPGPVFRKYKFYNYFKKLRSRSIKA